VNQLSFCDEAYPRLPGDEKGLAGDQASVDAQRQPKAQTEGIAILHKSLKNNTFSPPPHLNPSRVPTPAPKPTAGDPASLSVSIFALRALSPRPPPSAACARRRGRLFLRPMLIVP